MITVVDLLNILRSFRKLDRRIGLACFFGSLLTVVIHMDNLRIGHIHIQAAKTVNDLRQSVKVHCRVFCYIQVQVGVQHGDRLFRASVSVRRVCFGICVVSQVQKRIPVYRNQFYILCVIVDAGDDHGIAVFCPQSRVLIPVVNTEQGVSGVACKLGRFRVDGVPHFLVDLDLAFVHYRLVYFIQF